MIPAEPLHAGLCEQEQVSNDKGQLTKNQKYYLIKGIKFGLVVVTCLRSERKDTLRFQIVNRLH